MATVVGGVGYGLYALGKVWDTHSGDNVQQD